MDFPRDDGDEPLERHGRDPALRSEEEDEGAGGDLPAEGAGDGAAESGGRVAPLQAPVAGRPVSSSTGVRWYVGIPGSGKTYLALQHLREAIKRNGWPALMIDSIGEEQIRDVPHARSVREAIEWVWGAGEHAAYIPESIEEVNTLLRPCLDPGRVNLWIDEAHTWLTARRGVDGPLLRLMRTHRHARANLFLTAQHLTGDVPQEALSCAPEIYCFRCTAPAVLERLGREGIDPEAVKALPSREYIRHYEGF